MMPAQNKKKQCPPRTATKKKQGEKEEHREAGGRWSGKLQETAEAQSCVLCLGSRGKEDTSHRHKRQSQEY